jgi:hypothetical protein
MPDETQHRRTLARVVNQAMKGATNNTLQVTLAPSAPTTTVTDPRISLSTAPHVAPLTADAAAEIAGGLLYFAPSAGQCVIHHANSASADRTFAMSLIG